MPSEKSEELNQEYSNLKRIECQLIGQNNNLIEQGKAAENELQCLLNDLNDRVTECNEAMEYVNRQKREIEILKKENQDIWFKILRTLFL